MPVSRTKRAQRNPLGDLGRPFRLQLPNGSVRIGRQLPPTLRSAIFRDHVLRRRFPKAPIGNSRRRNDEVIADDGIWTGRSHEREFCRRLLAHPPRT